MSNRYKVGAGGSGAAGGTGGGGSKSVSLRKWIDIGGPEDVNIAAADRFYDSGIDMPAVSDIADDDLFIFDIQFRAAANPRLRPFIITGVAWKALGALTTAQQSQTSFSVASTRKTITSFLRLTSTSGAQSQQNTYVAKGADGISLYLGDNHSTFDSTLQVWREFTETETLGGGGGGPGETLPELTAPPDDIENNDLWNRDGLLVQEHVKHLSGSARAFTSYDISTPFVRHTTGVFLSPLIANVNYPSNWHGLFLEDEYATDGVRRPTAAGSNNRFGLNARTGYFEKSNGTDWLNYDPFADDAEWDKVYPYGAYVDTTFQSGTNQGKGIRITFAGKLPSIVGINGNEWDVYWYGESSITAASGVQVSTNTTGTRPILLIGCKAIDGGADAPTLVSIVFALNSFQPGGALAGFIIKANYIGGVSATDRIDGPWASDDFESNEEATIAFANGSTGDVDGVDLTRLLHWSETKAELDEAWSAAGQVGLDFAGADLHATVAYTEPAAEHVEKTAEIYKPPGFSQVVPIGPGDVRPAPSPATLGKLFLDYYRETATFDVPVPFADSEATGTATEYTNADYLGITTGNVTPPVAAADKVRYNRTYHGWHFSHASYVGPGFAWTNIDFEDIGAIAGLPADKFWLGERDNVAEAARAVQNYSAATRYYYLNKTSGVVEYLATYVAPVQEHTEYRQRALGLRTGFHNNPVAEFWLQGQTERWPGSYLFAASIGASRARLQWTSGGGSSTTGYLPSKAYFSNAAEWRDVMIVTADVSSDRDALGATFVPHREYWTAPAGIYRVTCRVAANQIDVAWAMGLVKVQSGTDDLVVHAVKSDPLTAVVLFGTQGVGSSAVIDLLELEVADGDQFVWVLFGLDASFNLRGFFRLERKS